MSDSHQVYADSDDVYDARLNQTEISGNKNKFYILQLLHPIGNSGASQLFTRWGRVGEAGANQTKVLSTYSLEVFMLKLPLRDHGLRPQQLANSRSSSRPRLGLTGRIRRAPPPRKVGVIASQPFVACVNLCEKENTSGSVSGVAQCKVSTLMLNLSRACRR